NETRSIKTPISSLKNFRFVFAFLDMLNDAAVLVNNKIHFNSGWNGGFVTLSI
ncbi:7196_t:CDS:2, partial [Diversispora eburnea]